mmetsp:Transcript_7292/g.21413  ORF Transcript_7292/g.21413 Transcript_7292/m.21413 type:complete len:225 (-) Transcript_7292:481-1155(-)
MEAGSRRRLPRTHAVAALRGRGRNRMATGRPHPRRHCLCSLGPNPRRGARRARRSDAVHHLLLLLLVHPGRLHIRQALQGVLPHHAAKGRQRQGLGLDEQPLASRHGTHRPAVANRHCLHPGCAQLRLPDVRNHQHDTFHGDPQALPPVGVHHRAARHRRNLAGTPCQQGPGRGRRRIRTSTNHNFPMPRQRHSTPNPRGRAVVRKAIRPHPIGRTFVVRIHLH